MKTLITTLLLVYSFASMAQTFELGLKAGVSSTNYAALSRNDILDVSQPLSFDPSNSIHFGVYSTITLGKWSIQPEVLYVPRKTTLNYFNRSVEQERKFLDIPVLLKKQLFGGFNFQIGPQVGLLLSADLEDVDITDDFNSIDLSGVAGLGWDSPVGLKASLRFIYSLGDINSNPSLGNVYGDLRNRTLQFSLAYPLMKR